MSGWQQVVSVSVLSYWREIAAVLLAYTALAGFALRAVFDRIMIGSYERNRREVLSIQAEWNKEDLARLTHVAQRADAHEDKLTIHDGLLTKLDAAQTAQGIALNATIDKHMNAINQGTAQIAATLQRIQIEAGQTTTTLGYMSRDIEGLKRPWDGRERRSP